MNKEEEKKASKRNIAIMIFLAILFIIAIATRWEHTKNEIKSSVNGYIERIKGE